MCPRRGAVQCRVPDAKWGEKQIHTEGKEEGWHRAGCLEQHRKSIRTEERPAVVCIRPREGDDSVRAGGGKTVSEPKRAKKPWAWGAEVAWADV